MDIFNPVGDGKALEEGDIAADLLRDSESSVISLAAAATGVDDEDARRLLARKLNVAVDQHHQLFDLLSRKEWYKPYLAPRPSASPESAADRPAPR